MKNIFLICTILLITNTVSAQTTTRKKPAVTTSTNTYHCPDFRKIKWGTMKDSILIDGVAPEFTRVKLKDDTNSYTIANDDMTIGTVVCKNIYYGFNGSGRLVKVKLIVPKAQRSDIKFIVESKFDKPTQIFDLNNAYELIWTNIEEVRLTLVDYDDPTADFVTLEFSSDFEMNEAKKINKAVDDF